MDEEGDVGAQVSDRFSAGLRLQEGAEGEDGEEELSVDDAEEKARLISQVRKKLTLGLNSWVWPKALIVN